MKTKLLTVALFVSAAMIAQANPGGHHGGGGGFAPAAAAPPSQSGGGRSFHSMAPGRFGGGPSFRSMPMQSFGSNRMIYSGQRFSSVARRTPRSMGFYGRSVNPNILSTNRGDRVSRFSNRGSRVITNPGRVGNRTAQVRNGSARLRPDWRNHVFAQHSTNWHRDWDRSRDHWWHGHRCHFFNGSWVLFDAGFNPWWDYPSDYYGYGYPYPYSYGYDPEYYGSDNYYDQNGYAEQADRSTIAAVQEQLARQGYYRGAIDGVVGDETQAALARYQKDHDLSVTGTLTIATLQALVLPQSAN